jgi:F0F1-type ATP synthase assembly protein I
MGATTLTVVDGARKLEAYLYGKSAETRHEAEGQSNAVLRFLQKVWAWAVEFLGGAAVGVAAGYLSHLAVDMLTPAGIPVL